MTIRGLGPRGERASTLTKLELSEDEAERARKGKFTVAVVLHTTSSDWARQQIAGMAATFGNYSTAVVEVVDCGFDPGAQIRALGRLATQRLSGVISIPVSNITVADAHRAVSESGTRLVLLDNAPTGLRPGRDYVSVVSCDNFGLGQGAAELLCAHVPKAGTIGMLTYGIDFFATHEREIAFRKWVETNRPDIVVKVARFTDVQLIAPVVDGMMTSHPALAGWFAVWDAPAMQALAALRARDWNVPIATVDLGNEVAIELAAGGPIKGVSAQRPYDQGVTAAIAMLQSLVGREPPTWIALPGLSVTQANVVEAYQAIWHSPVPRELIEALHQSKL